jgi:hypothetical protein
LNNPLKYTDPSGHEVFFCWEDPYVIELTQAWEKYRSLAPDSANFLMTCDEPILIRSADTNFKGGTFGDASFGQMIYINEDIIKLSKEQTTAVLAHESYHAMDGFSGATAEEEILAFQYQDSIQTIKLWSLLGKYNHVYDVDLSNTTDKKATITKWQEGLPDKYTTYKNADPIKDPLEIRENRPGYSGRASDYWKEKANEYGGAYQYKGTQEIFLPPWVYLGYI